MNNNIKIINKSDGLFPKLLSEIHDPPDRLFFVGELPSADEICVAIVGARKATHYGKAVTRKIVTELVQNGITIVSGLAYGIDAEAHRATLDAGGKTIAVLAGGVDQASISPRANVRLANEIVNARGALVSEHPPGTGSPHYHFPARNRIIAGFCKATIIIEATAKSGTMITARSALSENRDVCAVPGPITSPLSEGPHSLIKDGATIVTCTQDILEVIDLTAAHMAADVTRVVPTTESELALLNELDHEPTLVDDLARKMNKPIAEITNTLTLLELKSLVTHVGSGCFTKT